MEIGVHVLPSFPKDTTDRNRTSPFAFTGNKFEFRSLGSSQSISGPNIILNTIVAEELKQFADELEGAEDFTEKLNELIKKTIKEHKRIIFNGDGYSDEWKAEAKKRGLLNLKTTVDALPTFLAPKNVELFTKHKIFTEKEMESRYEILLETYSKVINIEGLTMVDMAKKQILPAVNSYIGDLASTAKKKLAVTEGLSCKMEKDLLEKLSVLEDSAYDKANKLAALLEEGGKISDGLAQATFYKDQILPAMEALRSDCDALEVDTAESSWPFPQYGDLLFHI